MGSDMLKSKKLSIMVCVLFLSPWAVGCFGASPAPGADSLINSSTEPAGSNCRYGGVRIESGLDQNYNGWLDLGEISDVSFACAARVDGATSLIGVAQEPAGAHCAEGGLRITAGLDDDDDGVLSANEIESTAYSCDGDPGVDGEDGRHGVDGEDGFTTLIDVSDEPPSPDGECLFGGTRIEAGLDLDRNGELSDEEITAVQVVCVVPVNEHMTLVSNSQELPGDHCEHGGVRTDIGIDDDNDMQLDPEEVDDTTYLCNEVILVPGQTALLVSIPATETQCPFGGYVLTSGLDADYDGVLDSEEIANVLLVCDGRDGYVSLSDTEPYEGPACSDQGGWRLRTGLDLDYDGVLDSGEILSNSIVCNGRDGFLGYDGKNSLIRVTEDTRVCVYGGFQFEVGLDQDEDNVLDANEVQTREYVCDGVDGMSSLVEVTDESTVCPYGGSLFKVGLDRDHDGVLDPIEVEAKTVLCDGIAGYNSVIEVFEAGEHICPYGGVIYQVGLDFDADGYLDADEVEVETYVCDGYDGYNSLIDLIEASYAECPYGGVVILVGLDLDEDGYLDDEEVESEAVICD